MTRELTDPGTGPVPAAVGARVPPRSYGALVTYALPATGMGFTGLLIDTYLLRYTEQTLLVAPAWMALWLWTSRVWDAISDPILGSWSDRTHTRWGRRRPWIVAGALPVGGAFWMLWSPPAALVDTPLALWVGLGLVLYYTGMTLVDVPHHALGAELCRDYDQRTRLFGVRRIVLGAGAVSALAALHAFDSQPDPVGRRAIGFWVGGAGALLFAATALASVWRTPEGATTPQRPRGSPLRSFGDVLRNPHARVLLVIAFLQQGGVAALVAMLPFYSDHVLRTPGRTALYVGVFLLSSFASVPLVVRFAGRFDRRTLMLAAMAAVAAALMALGFAPAGQVAVVIAIGAVAGLGAGVCDAVGPALQADIIDYDEYATRERKEGAYFALWALVAKVSRASALALVALLLVVIDLEPGPAQSTQTVWSLRLTSGLLPALLYLCGTLLFTRYRLTREEHARIRRALAERAGAGQPSS